MFSSHRPFYDLYSERSPVPWQRWLRLFEESSTVLLTICRETFHSLCTYGGFLWVAMCLDLAGYVIGFMRGRYGSSTSLVFLSGWWLDLQGFCLTFADQKWAMVEQFWKKFRSKALLFSVWFYVWDKLVLFTSVVQQQLTYFYGRIFYSLFLS